jgi:dethiobiotin synthetase
LVGTDTDCGKTAVTCALARSARARGYTVLPFKPASSGPEGPESDPQRLLRAAGLPSTALEKIAPLRFAPPLAPGIAEHREYFTGEPPTLSPALTLRRVALTLTRSERELNAQVTLIEGAGGLHVPMPGGTWLPR